MVGKTNEMKRKVFPGELAIIDEQNKPTKANRSKITDRDSMTYKKS